MKQQHRHWRLLPWAVLVTVLALPCAWMLASPDTHGIGEDYDPTSPGNPSQPSATYPLYLEVDPVNAGYFNYNSGNRYSEGTSLRLYAYSNSGFVFKCWTQGTDTVSTSYSYSFTMPAEEVALVAHYEYDPTSPANPSEPVLSHPITVVSEPAGAYSFSYSSSVAAGSSFTIYAYLNDYYHYTGFSVNGVENDENFTLTEYSSYVRVRGTMGDDPLNFVFYADFNYNPSNPGNPGANYWNSTTGQLIIDDFTAGSLSSAMSSKLSGSSYSDVLSIIVKGNATTTDLRQFGSSFSSLVKLDLSRVDSIATTTTYQFQYCYASEILLPSCISTLSNYAFYGCENLQQLSLYGSVPPTVTQNTFYTGDGYLYDEDKACVLHVPAEAISLYQEAEYWNKFTIMALTEELHAVQISLPSVAGDGRYKNCYLELVNVHTGSRQRYVVTDRMNYTFTGLPEDNRYIAYLLTSSGLKLGETEEILIGNEDIEIVFDSLKGLHTVTAAVVLPDGTDVTNQCTVEWYNLLADQSQTYLKQAASISEIPDEQSLVCKVTLPQTLAMAYYAPDETTIIVDDDNTAVNLALSPLRSIAISGAVADEDGVGLQGATVTITQTLGGKYSKTTTATTDRKGQWSATVLDAPTVITYAATECVNSTQEIAEFDAVATDYAAGTVALRSIVGARITYSFTWLEASEESAEPSTTYSDGKNVAVTVYDVTQDRALSDVSVQFPLIVVLDENVGDSDQLRLTAQSTKSAFADVVETVTLEEGRAEVTFDLVGKGAIKATFNTTDNASVNAMLYNANGNLIKTGSYSEASISFTDLDAGQYKLVTLGQSDLLNSVQRYSTLTDLGLTLGTDFVANDVAVKDGVISVISNDLVPLLNDNQFRFTTTTSTFTANKTVVTTGNYVTLSSRMDFKSAYKDGVTNIEMVFDLPENCILVANSLMKGAELYPYSEEADGRIVVNIGSSGYTDQIRFVVTPSEGGLLNPTASVRFYYGTQQVTQPFGTVNVTAKDLDFVVPDIVTKTEFTASGYAPTKSQVKIYADDQLIGETKALASGQWNAECNLLDAYNMSEYDVYAQILTTNGYSLRSATEEVTYIKDYPSVKTVTMTTSSGTSIVFDFESTTVSASWYYTPSSALFTIDFSNNSPEVIQEVYLNIFGEDGSVKTIDCDYDANKDLWFANATFNSYNCPVNVSVNYIAKGDYSYESAEADLLRLEYEEIFAEEQEIAAEVEDLLTKVGEEASKDNPDEETINIYFKKNIGIHR
ncbi:MAG: hypothetical protein LIP03_03655 [Bacteroidales bacterium]|nr:hypothetical protein [Bacteroidales bacterium]